jgi:hypothetical protein
LDISSLFQKGPTPPLTSRSQPENSTLRLATSIPRVCLTVLLNTLLLSIRSCCLRSRFTMPLLHSGPFRHLLSLSRSSCCFRPRSLMPLLSFSCVRRLFSNVRPLRAPRTTQSLVRFIRRLFLTVGSLSPRPILRAGRARRVFRLRATANFFRDPPSS